MNRVRQNGVDIDRLSALLAGKLGEASLSLTPIAVSCAWPVFKGVTSAGEPLFVKLSDRHLAEKSLDFLSCARDCRLLARPRIPGLLDFDGYVVLCLEWKRAVRVNAVDMTDCQMASFLLGCGELQDVLNAYRGEVLPDEEDSPDRQYALLVDYARRHPLLAGLMRPLLSIPEPERSYRGRALVTIHGDLQEENYGFDGDQLSAVFDFDMMRKGLACEDAAYAFSERARRSGLSARARRRLADLFLSFVRASPWPADEWLVALNHARLRIASRRVERSPHSPFIALDVARRDRPLRRFVAVLKESCDMTSAPSVRDASVCGRKDR